MFVVVNRSTEGQEKWEREGQEKKEREGHEEKDREGQERKEREIKRGRKGKSRAKGRRSRANHFPLVAPAAAGAEGFGQGGPRAASAVVLDLAVRARPHCTSLGGRHGCKTLNHETTRSANQHFWTLHKLDENASTHNSTCNVTPQTRRFRVACATPDHWA